MRNFICMVILFASVGMAAETKYVSGTAKGCDEYAVRSAKDSAIWFAGGGAQRLSEWEIEYNYCYREQGYTEAKALFEVYNCMYEACPDGYDCHCIRVPGGGASCDCIKI